MGNILQRFGKSLVYSGIILAIVIVAVQLTSGKIPRPFWGVPLIVVGAGIVVGMIGDRIQRKP